MIGFRFLTKVSNLLLAKIEIVLDVKLNHLSFFSSIVQDLGTSFCKLKASELTDEHLMAKPTKKRPVGRPRKNKGASSSQDKGDGDAKGPKEGANDGPDGPSKDNEA